MDHAFACEAHELRSAIDSFRRHAAAVVIALGMFSIGSNTAAADLASRFPLIPVEIDSALSVHARQTNNSASGRIQVVMVMSREFAEPGDVSPADFDF